MALPSVNPEASAGTGRGGDWRRAVSPLLWAGGALLLSRSDAAVRAAPVLGTLRGPIGVVLAVVALVLAAASAAPRVRLPAPGSRALFAVAWAFLLVIGLSYTARLRVTGDEPHYLLMAQSLWREHDLDLRDNLAREDWREYTPGPLAPHYGFPRADGRPFPAHSPGLPFLLAPLYALGGRPLCVAVLTLFGALLGVEMWRAARERGTGEEAALLAWSLVLLPPVAFYSFHVYTEVPAALAVALALRLIAAEAAAREPRPGRAMAAAVLASTLPWLHLKMVGAAIVLGLGALVLLRGRARLAFLATAAVMAVLFLGYYRAIFGVASPLAIYGGVPRDANGSPLRALAGLLLDRSFGLLPYAPVFLIALIGLASVARSRDWLPLAAGLAVIAPVLPWRMWWGGQCPPARFLVPMVPLLGLALARRVAASPRGIARWRWPLAVLGVATTVGMTASPGALLLVNRAGRPTRLWEALSGERPVGAYLPSLVSAVPDEVRVALVWLAATAIVMALDVLARRREGVDALFRGLGLPLVLLLAIGIAVDGWARRAPAAAEPPPSIDESGG